MPGTIVVCGHGPGISSAVARRFGKEGFRVALVSRTAEKLEAGVKALEDAGVVAKAFPCDLAEAGAVTRMIADVREQLGPITVLHWNAYAYGAGDLTTADPDELHQAFDVSATRLVEAVQASLPDLRTQEGAAVLVTGGGLAFYDAKVDAMAVEWKAMGLAIGKAAQHKAVGLLHQRLAPEKVYVADLLVLGVVKGTAFDRGQGTLDPDAIADRFWTMYQDRSEVTATFGGR
jgi:NADP-dependent 3-hydroxy acid dehydrogenase YdfG